MEWTEEKKEEVRLRILERELGNSIRKFYNREPTECVDLKDIHTVAQIIGEYLYQLNTEGFGHMGAPSESLMESVYAGFSEFVRKNTIREVEDRPPLELVHTTEQEWRDKLDQMRSESDLYDKAIKEEEEEYERVWR